MTTASELATVVAEGGLEAANRLMASVLEGLRVSDGHDREVREGLLKRLNALLYDAIFFCPHLIRGIDVVMRPGVYGRLEALDAQYYTGDYKFHLLRRFGEAWSAQRGSLAPETLRLPLPYGYSTGTHGSGERSARMASREELVFSEMHPRDLQRAHATWGVDVPCLHLAIEVPVIVYMYTSLPLDEVLEVRFTAEDGYVPYYSDHWDKERNVLLARGSHLHRYLRFRDFSMYSSSRKRAQAPSLTDAQWEECQRLLSEPDHLSNLWVQDWSRHPDRHLKRGVLVVWVGDPNAMTMYEIVDADMPHEDGHVAAALWFAQYHGTQTLPDNVHRYQGYAIIERLAQIPISERRF